MVVGDTVTLPPDNEPGIHEYVVAPLPVSVVELPEHIVGGAAVAPTVGVAFTVTVTVAEPVQPPVLPVTVYVVVAEGLATTEEPVAALSPVDGLHEYVVAPPAVSVVEFPLHIEVEGETVTVGVGETVTVAVAVPGHCPVAEAVTVYTVVVPGVAVTAAPVVALNPAAGDHV